MKETAVLEQLKKHRKDEEGNLSQLHLPILPQSPSERLTPKIGLPGRPAQCGGLRLGRQANGGGLESLLACLHFFICKIVSGAALQPDTC